MGLCYCGDVTYISIEEECRSLSNVGNGQRTRQVTLAQKPQPLIFSLAEFSTVRCSLRSSERAALIAAEIRFDSCCILQEESQSIWWELGPVTLKAFLPTLSRRSQSPSHFPDRCPGHCSNQTYFSERKPDPASCQCHQSHSIPSPLLSGMHFSHPFLFSIPLVSRQRCPGQSQGSVFGCPRSIHPLWWNRILGAPLCLLVSISG